MTAAQVERKVMQSNRFQSPTLFKSGLSALRKPLTGSLGTTPISCLAKLRISAQSGEILLVCNMHEPIGVTIHVLWKS